MLHCRPARAAVARPAKRRKGKRVRRCSGVFWLAIAAGLGGGCTPAPPEPPPALSRPWMIGIERMRGDPLLLAPFTNRFLADLAAMPHTQVVYLGSDENAFLFNAATLPRLRTWTWLRGEGNCMEITYSVIVTGQQTGTYGLVIPALPAGPEPDAACVDRAATELYAALARQGL